LELEFKERLLNGFMYTCPTNGGPNSEERLRTYTKATELAKETAKALKIGANTTADVNRVLGAPSGRALFPSSLLPSKGTYDGCHDVNSYYYGTASENVIETVIRVGFDVDGRVKVVRIE
jgi:hypothetical protein